MPDWIRLLSLGLLCLAASLALAWSAALISISPRDVTRLDVSGGRSYHAYRRLAGDGVLIHPADPAGMLPAKRASSVERFLHRPLARAERTANGTILLDEAYGWPYRCTGWGIVDQSGGTARGAIALDSPPYSIELHSASTFQMTFPSVGATVLPVRILWTGLFLNATISFAAVIFISSMFVAAKRAHRRSRRLCQSCAYPLLSAGPVCPECGEAEHSRPRRRQRCSIRNSGPRIRTRWPQSSRANG